jgi:predicted nucleotide-binding protein
MSIEHLRQGVQQIGEAAVTMGEQVPAVRAAHQERGDTLDHMATLVTSLTEAITKLVDDESAKLAYTSLYDARRQADTLASQLHLRNSEIPEGRAIDSGVTATRRAQRDFAHHLAGAEQLAVTELQAAIGSIATHMVAAQKVWKTRHKKLDTIEKRTEQLANDCTAYTASIMQRDTY